MRHTILLVAAALAEAQTWHGWGGPTRNFVAPSASLLESWPKSGPIRAWSRPMGDGYSAIAVDGDTLYTAYRSGSNDRVVALEAATGRTIWEADYPSPFRSAFPDGSGPGPYAMPQVVGDRLAMATGTGKLLSIDRKTGRAVWHRELWSDLGGTKLPYGYASHVLPYADSLICLVGGGWWGGGIARFRQSDGQQVWKRAAFENAYSSPILIEAGGRKQVVAVGAKQIVSLDPESGETIWTQDHETDYGIAVSTPVWNGAGLLFVSSAYGKGAQVFRVTATTATRVWADAKLQSHFGTGVVRDGVLYFLSGYNGPAFLTAVDFETGKVRWQERGFSKGQLLLSGNLLVVLDQEGVLGLVRADPARFQELARWQALEKSAWTPPTLVGSRLYLRDRKTIMALELANR